MTAAISPAQRIRQSETALGIELGSTRIKSVLIDTEGNVLASGSFQWENRLVNGLWTYSLEDAVRGLQQSYADLASHVKEDYGLPLTAVGSIGISGMMHGYLPLDKDGRQLSSFLTWRNTNTGEAAAILSERFSFNVPLRWSISQLYQAMLNREEHVARLAHLTTLAGYIHFRLTGKHAAGLDEASGMFPIDPAARSYDASMLRSFSELAKPYGYPWRIEEVLPDPLSAGENAGTLTPEGAALLDPTGTLQAGIPFAPPEGDAGTGMVATNSVAAGTGNVSAGTSIFSMIVLEKPLSRVYRDIDIVTTPSGKAVAMVHCNNGTSEIDAWFRLLGEFAAAAGHPLSAGEIYGTIFAQSLLAEADGGGVIHYNFVSGEPVIDLLQGVPLLLRVPESRFTFANFARSLLCSTLASLVIGNEILQQEQVKVIRLTGHGGLFKTPEPAQRALSAAFRAPVTVMETAGEGGAYGMALLALYLQKRSVCGTLEDFLDTEIFARAKTSTLCATEDEVHGFTAYMARYKAFLPTETAAVEKAF